MSLWNHFFTYIPSFNLRYIILKYLYRAKLGKCSIHMGVKFFSPWKLVVGDNSNIQYGSFLDCRGGLFIGDNVDITLFVKILTEDHDVRSNNYNTRNRPVYIKNNVVIGSYALILPGSTIDKYGVLGAGSVLSGCINEDEIFIGNPASKISERKIESSFNHYYERPFH